MSRAEAFLQAIREDPDDDVARLVFADWLTDHGDPRGEFLHVQVRLAALPEGDPTRLDLAERAADLLSEYEAEWVGMVAQVAQTWEFRRGFVERVTMEEQDFLDCAGELTRAVPLRSVRLLNARAGGLEELAACPHLSGIEELEQSFPLSPTAPPALTSKSLAVFLASPHLRRCSALALTGNALGHPELETLLAAPLLSCLRRLDLTGNTCLGRRAGLQFVTAPRTAGLEELVLSQTRLGTGGLLTLLNSKHFLRLHRLEVAHAEISETPDGALGKALAASPVLPHLTVLDLNRGGGLYPLWDLGNLLNSPQLASLRVLRVSHVEMGDAGSRALAGSTHLRHLTALDLAGNDLTPDAAQALADSPHLARLTELNLAGNQLRDRGTKALAASPHLTRLRSLDLSGNAIGGPGLRALTSSPNLTRLTTLRLQQNFIGKEAVGVLAGSDHLAQHLTCLDLSQHGLDADAAGILAFSPQLSRLERLDLSSNQLGDAGLRTLAASPWLTRLVDLEVATNGIGHEGSDALIALFANSPVLRGLRRLGLKGNAFSDVEKDRLRTRFGKRLDLGWSEGMRDEG